MYYFANVNSNTVSVINTSSNAVIATISVHIFFQCIVSLVAESIQHTFGRRNIT
ncbi:hypothetical protein H7U08_30190 [Bacillus cereus]|uniref:Uncharacterized protein n=1 Tax=Bacillus cereus TaxID=1396 RepID=A0AAW4R265_BACCE|nr:hypothetical protein [Bacillus cereus]